MPSATSFAQVSKARYGIARELGQVDFSAARAAIEQALSAHGFGVLTTIDLQQTMKKKLDVDMPPYVILGACNPPLAHQALEAEPAVGLLLPCNVVVAQHENGVVVSAVDPAQLFGVVDRPELTPVAQQVRDKLVAAIESIRVPA